MEKAQPQRFIGIRHRVKKTADGESRPTQIAILQGEVTLVQELEDENAELDFALGRFPFAYRDLNPGEDASSFPAHHIKERKKGDENVIKVPSAYDGLMAGDTVGMVLGGSGDALAFALSRRAEQIGAKVLRIPPFTLKEYREGDKDDDAASLAKLVQNLPELFYEVSPRDRALIRVREALQARQDAMKARIACEQRLRQHLIGKVFTSEDGLYPEGSIEKLYDEAKANDKILQALLEEENKREKDVAKTLGKLDVYQELFAPIKGVGPMIGARIISAIIDIRRFPTAPKLKAFCGVHVLSGGRFARRRQGQVANWNPTARQALYLLGDQFNRRPDTLWGQKLLEYKRKFREKHPEPVVVDGKKRYTNGHIHKMALWRTLTKFVERLHRDWWKLEKRQRKPALEPFFQTVASVAEDAKWREVRSAFVQEHGTLKHGTDFEAS